MRPPTSTRPEVGLTIPATQAQQRRLAGAVAADEADRLAGLDRERDVAQRPDVGAPVPLRANEQILERAALARVDAEAPRGVLDEDLSGSHAGDGTDRCRRTISASVRTKAGSSFGISIRASVQAELARELDGPRRRGPSGSRGGRRRSRPGR